MDRVFERASVNILALDTSTEFCSAALWLDGSIDERETLAGQTHSNLLLGMVDELLDAHALRVRDLDGIAFGEGPGSFTGLRIACGVVQGVAFGADLPVVGVGTLLAMAAGSGAERVVCCLDARVHEIYHAAYERNAGVWRAVHEPSLCAPEAVPDLLGGGWLAVGSAFRVYRGTLEQRYAGRLKGVEPDRYPHARDIAALSIPRFVAGTTMTAEAAAPLYLRDKVALRIDEQSNRLK
jgi:tRNA threonylcarbamoyladenosine biosynthesis protein TsaB